MLFFDAFWRPPVRIEPEHYKKTELVRKFKYWLLDLIKKLNVLFISIVNLMDK